MGNDIDIKITTKGDAKGAKDVAKGMKEVEKSTEKATAAAKKNAKQSQSNFPTFKKMGGAAKGLGANLLSLMNPWALLATAVAAAVGKILDEYKKWEARQDEITEMYKEQMPVIRSELDRTETAETLAADAVSRHAEEQRIATSATNERINSLKEQASDLERVRQAETEAAKAAIDYKVATGELTKEQGASRKATLDSAAAETSLASKIDTAKKVQTLREKELAKAREAGEKARRKALQAEAQLNEFERAGDSGERAATFNPSLNEAVKSGIQNKSDVEAKIAAEKSKIGPDEDRIESLENRRKEEIELLKKAQQEREEANQAEQKRLQSIAKNARQQSNSADQRVGAASGELTKAETAFQRTDTTERSVFEADKRASDFRDRTRRVSNSSPVTSPAAGSGEQSLGSQIGAAQSSITGTGSASVAARSALGQLKEAVTDGASAKELETITSIIESLLATIEQGNSKLTALDSKVKQLQSQQAESRNQATSR